MVSPLSIVPGLCLALSRPGRKAVSPRTLLKAQRRNLSREVNKKPKFPPNFIFGAATSSYQIEGAAFKDGRGPTVWDTYAKGQPSAILDYSNGDIACDHYHRVKEDVQLMKDINLKAYRFSIAWSRILPNGTRGVINQAGIDFYNHLIDTLLENGITPMVTLFHWETPQALEDEFGGWLDRRTADAFATDFARIAFEQFGDRVKHWITLNEPWTVSVLGYNSGIHAPGRNQKPTTEPYIAAHNFLLAHAQATHIYRTEFQSEQQGVIGIANNCDYRYPLIANDMACQEAADRSMLFHFGWFINPLFFGDYPSVMRDWLGDRLPKFSEAERELLLSANTDFLGLNYYSSTLVSVPERKSQEIGYWDDMHVAFHDQSDWRKTAMGWNVVPNGLEDLLLWISRRYNNPKIYITENGSAEDEPHIDAALNDENRRKFYEDHLRACSKAIHAGADVAGYFAWSLMDNYGTSDSQSFSWLMVWRLMDPFLLNRMAVWLSEAIRDVPCRL